MFGIDRGVLARCIAPWRSNVSRGALGGLHGGAGEGAIGSQPLPARWLVASDHGDFEPVEIDDGLPDGVWPDDPDATPHWLQRKLDRALERGLSLPQIATRRQFDAAQERCLRAFQAPATETEPALAELSAETAAAQFLAHLRTTVSGAQRFTSDALSERYAVWCALEPRRPPTPENMMRGALKQLPGVDRKQVRTSVDGRPVRAFEWTVYPVNTPETQAKPKAKPSIVSGERVAA